MDRLSDRRRFLRLGGALVAGTAGAALAGRAEAFRMLPGEDYTGIIERSCGAANRLHRELVAEAEAALGVKLSDEEARRLIAQIQCPYCGCSILQGATASGEAPF